LPAKKNLFKSRRPLFSARLRRVALALVLALSVEQAASAASAASELRAVFAGAPPSLNFPAAVAVVEESYRAPGARKTLILVQDAHVNESAQKNIARLLESIAASGAARWIFLEGGAGDDSLAALRTLGTPAARERIAKEFLAKGHLQGADYFDLTSSRDARLWGVEDKALYAESLALYRSIKEASPAVRSWTEAVDRALATLKPRLYSPELLAFDERRRAFVSSGLALTDYLDALFADAEDLGVVPSDFPALASLRSIKTAESKIDFAKAGQEQARAAASLGAEDQKELLASALRERAPSRLDATARAPENAFYALLEEKIKDRAAYPNLFRYADYLKAAARLDAAAVLLERERLEEALYSALASTPDEKRLVRAAAAQETLRSVFSLTAASREVARIERDPLSYDAGAVAGFLNRKLMDTGVSPEAAVFLEPVYAPTLEKARRFYRLTTARDEAFLERAFRKMDDERESSAVLVAGGYHAENLKKLLREKGVSYVSLAPRVLTETNHAKYESILLSQAVGGEVLPGAAERLGIVPARECVIVPTSGKPFSVYERLRGRLAEASPGAAPAAARLPSEVDFAALEGRTLRDRTGEEYRLRIVERDGETFVAVDNLNVNFWQEPRPETAWGLLAIVDSSDYDTIARIPYGEKADNGRTVAYAAFLPGTDGPVLRYTETRPFYRGRGIFAALVGALSTVTSPGTPVTVDTIVHPEGPALFRSVFERAGFREVVSRWAVLSWTDRVTWPRWVTGVVLSAFVFGPAGYFIGLAAGGAVLLLRYAFAGSPNLVFVKTDPTEPSSLPSVPAGARMAARVEREVVRLEGDDARKRTADEMARLMRESRTVRFYTLFVVVPTERLAGDAPYDGPNLERMFFNHHLSDKAADGEARFILKKAAERDARVDALGTTFRILEVSPPAGTPEEKAFDPFYAVVYSASGARMAVPRFNYVKNRTLSLRKYYQRHEPNPSSYDGILSQSNIRDFKDARSPFLDLLRNLTVRRGRSLVWGDVGPGFGFALREGRILVDPPPVTYGADVVNWQEKIFDNDRNKIATSLGVEAVRPENDYRFVPGSAESVVFPEAPDVISAFYVLAYSEEPLAAFQNLYNQLPEGGVLVGSTFRSLLREPGMDPPADDWYSRIVRELNGAGLEAEVSADVFFAVKGAYDIEINLEVVSTQRSSYDDQVTVRYRKKDELAPLVGFRPLRSAEGTGARMAEAAPFPGWMRQASDTLNESAAALVRVEGQIVPALATAQVAYPARRAAGFVAAAERLSVGYGPESIDAVSRALDEIVTWHAEVAALYSAREAAQKPKAEAFLRSLLHRTNVRGQNLSLHPDYGRVAQARAALDREARAVEAQVRHARSSIAVLRLYRALEIDGEHSRHLEFLRLQFPALRRNFQEGKERTLDRASKLLEKAISGRLSHVLKTVDLGGTVPGPVRDAVVSDLRLLLLGEFVQDVFIAAIYQHRFEELRTRLVRIVGARDRRDIRPEDAGRIAQLVHDLEVGHAAKDVDREASDLYRQELALLASYKLVSFFADFAVHPEDLEILLDVYPVTDNMETRIEVVVSYFRVLWRLFRRDGERFGFDEVLRRVDALETRVAASFERNGAEPRQARKEGDAVLWMIREARVYLRNHRARFERFEPVSFTDSSGQPVEESFSFLHAFKWSRQEQRPRSRVETWIASALRRHANRSIMREVHNREAGPSTIQRRLTAGGPEKETVESGARMSPERQVLFADLARQLSDERGTVLAAFPRFLSALAATKRSELERAPKPLRLPFDLSVDASSEKPAIFDLEWNGENLVGRAEGMEPLSAEPLRAETRAEAPLADMRTLEDDLDRSVNERLAGIRARASTAGGKAKILLIDVDAFADGAFTSQMEAFLEEFEKALGSYARGARVQLVSNSGRATRVARAMRTPASRRLAAAGALSDTLPVDWEHAVKEGSAVRVNLAAVSPQGIPPALAADILQIPIRRLSAGDIPAIRAYYELMLAVADADLASPEDLAAITSVWQTLSRQAVDSAALFKVIRHTASLEILLKHALLPLVPVDWDVAARYLQYRRQVDRSA